MSGISGFKRADDIGDSVKGAKATYKSLDPATITEKDYQTIKRFADEGNADAKKLLEEIEEYRARQAQTRVNEEPQKKTENTQKTEKAQKTTDQKKEPPNSKKPKEPETPKKDSNLGGKVKKAGVTGAIGTALLKIANDTVKEATQKGIRRSNINEDPHIISTYTGTGLRELSFLFPLIPPNSSKANEYIYALLTLKALISGLQLSESKSNILVSQDYIFTIEFGSKNPAIAETVKAVLGKMLEIKENTEFNITGMTVDYAGLVNAESAVRPDGMPLGYSFKLDFQERRPLRMEEESQNAEISNKQNDKQQVTDEVIDKGI